MQLEDTDKVTNALPIRPGFPQLPQYYMVGGWPVFAPAPNRLRKIECIWTLFEQRQIMERIKHILFALVASGMTGQQFYPIPNFHMERVRFERHSPARTVGWDTVPVCLEL